MAVIVKGKGEVVYPTPEYLVERINELTAQRDRLREALRDALPIAEQEYPSCDFRGKLEPGDLPEDFDPPFWEEVGLPEPTHTPDGDMTGA